VASCRHASLGRRFDGRFAVVVLMESTRYGQVVEKVFCEDAHSATDLVW